MNNYLAVAALRQHLKGVVVATTGATELAATAIGYTRSSGSFLDEGFVSGMEVMPSGFTVTTPGLIKSVTDETMVIEGGRSPENSAGGRTLSVGLPLLRGWENMEFTPEDRRWYIEEDYIPGPGYQATLGREGELHREPMYVIRLYGIAGKGIQALYLVADAILRQFRPNIVISMSDGTALRVRNDIIPSRGQVMAEGASHAVIVITIPLWARTLNNGA